MVAEGLGDYFSLCRACAGVQVRPASTGRSQTTGDATTTSA